MHDEERGAGKGGRPPKPYRLKKSKMIGARFTPHHVTMLRALASEGESLTATLERLAAHAMATLLPGQHRYFTADEARLASAPLDLEGVPGELPMRATRGELGLYTVELLEAAGAWRELARGLTASELPIHEEE